MTGVQTCALPISPKMVDDVCQDSVYTGLFQAKTKKRFPRKWYLLARGLAIFVVVSAVGIILVMQNSSTPLDPIPGGQGLPLADVAKDDARPAWEYEGHLSDDAPEGVLQDTQAKASPEVVVVVEEPGAERLPESGAGSGPDLPQFVMEGAPKDGNMHPVIGELVIGAIAWNEDAAVSIAVINSKLLHEGEFVDDVKVTDIGQDYVLFEYENELFQRTILR